MPVYKYFGHPARFHGKPLFHILCNLKKFGEGRIVTRTQHEMEKDYKELPSFYRILWAQPLMDKETLEGRVVAERVRKGVRYQQPVDLADIAPLPDFKLVPRDLEGEVCRWEALRDYTPEMDQVKEPKYFSVPPLLRLLMERNMKERGEEIKPESFLLPHYKSYIPKDTEEVHVADLQAPGKKSRERVRRVKHQETVTRCEGTASYEYSAAVGEEYWPGTQDVIASLPEEAPMPTPAVGMRLYRWPDDSKNHKEELRTEEHNTFFP